MKSILKKLIIVLVGVSCFSACAITDKDKPITVNQLPAAAQQMIKKNFPNNKVAMAKQEKDVLKTSYDVVFTNGDKIEFDSKGNWTEISCKNSFVPLALIPVQIQNYVQQNYPDNKIIEIDRDKKEYDVKLSNGIEITFNTKFQVIEMD